MRKPARGMDRRQALRRLVTGAGASAALPAFGRSATTPAGSMPGMPMPQDQSLGSAKPPDPALNAKDWKPKFFDEHQNETVVLLSDLIIPETETPGAKAAQINRFIDLYLSASTPDVQRQYLQALGWLDGHCLSQHSKPFRFLDPVRQGEILTLLTHANDSPQIGYGVELFRVIKESIVESYYRSEVGLLQELKYETNPFQPEFPGCKHPANEH